MVSSCTLSTLGPMRRREAGSSAFEERPATSAGDTRMVRKLTKAEARALAQAAALPEGQIDTNDPDAPERIDGSRAVRGLLPRPAKKQTSLELDVDILDWFESHSRAGRCQRELNSALRETVSKD